MALCAAHVPSSSLNKMSVKTPSTKHRSSRLDTVLLKMGRLDSVVRLLNKSGISRNSAA